MTDTNTVARSLHDAGLAAWFGGSLMGAVGLNGAAAKASDPRERNLVASEGWARWTPVNLAAIGAHVAGSVGLLAANRGRVAAQAGVARTSAVKTVLMGAALAATGYSRVLGQRVMSNQDAPVSGATEPRAETPDEVARAQRQLRALQWAIPALTGAIVVVNAYMGEQQRPASVASGIVSRLLPG